MVSIVDGLKNSLGFTKKEIPVAEAPQSKKVLIVEDEETLSEALADGLTRAGYSVMRGTNGQVGLQLAISFVPDVILLDLLMPVMDGKQMLAKLREMPPFKKTPVIIFSNAGTVENIRETTSFYNASVFLVKSNTSLDEIIKQVQMFVS